MSVFPVIWLFGLPCSGKTTLAQELKQTFVGLGNESVILDGDDMRKRFSPDLGFTMADRFTHIKRTVEYAGECQADHKHVIVSLITPLELHREYIKQVLPSVRLCFLDCPVDVCETRDVKGLYKEARMQRLSSFTGVSHPFESPGVVDLTLHTDRQDIEVCREAILDVIYMPG